MRCHKMKCQPNRPLLLFSATKFGNQLEALDTNSHSYMKDDGYLGFSGVPVILNEVKNPVPLGCFVSLSMT